MPPEPILQLRSCVIRPYHEGDIEPLAKAANNPKISRWMRNTFPQPYTVDDAKAWISIANSSSPLYAFAICEPGGPVIGGIGLKPGEDVQYRTMEIGFWLGEEHWGNGIATDAVMGFSEWAFGRFEALLRLEAVAFEGNAASAGVLGKASFELEGRQRMAVEKGGVVLDTLTYCRFREGC